MNNKLSERYNRHLVIPEIGIEGQNKLFNASILVVGAGGLGASALQYLVAAGVGTIGILDHDTVSLSNLQRQVLYNESHLNKHKVLIAKETLSNLNSDTTIKCYPFALNEENASDIIPEFDIIIGATDNFSSRIIIDKQSKENQIPFVNGSINEFEGQVSVFNYNGSLSYTNLFPDIPTETKAPMGVISPLPGIIGSMQACEAIKIILNIGNILTNKILIYNALNLSFNILEFD